MPPTTARSGAPRRPSKHAVVGHVSTVWPTRSTSLVASPSALNAKTRTLAPGRPSGVSRAGSMASIPASTLRPMTEVAKPVIAVAAVRAHASDAAVMITRDARMSNASANVSAMSTPRRSRATGSPDQNLALAWNGRVTRVALVRVVPLIARQRESQVTEIGGVHAEETGNIGGRVQEGRHHRQPAERNDGAAHHPRPGTQFRAAAEDDGAALHLQAGKVAHGTADGNDATLHP